MEEKSKSKARSGCKIYKGLEIPSTVKIHTNKAGREFYITAINERTATVRYIDDGKFTEISYEVIKKYL